MSYFLPDKFLCILQATKKVLVSGKEVNELGNQKT